MLQTHYQNTSTRTSAHLAQTMTLLSLTSGELRQKIDAELANNPALELIEERRCPMCKRILPQSGSCPVCSQPNIENSDDPIVFISPRNDFYTSGSSISNEVPEDPFSSEPVDLPTFVLRQIAPELEPDERLIAVYILTNLTEDGFLTIKPIEIARYHHRMPSDIEALIHRLQRCEPFGVCASGPKEALLTQVEILSETTRVPKLTKSVIEEGLEYLSHHQFTELAHLLGVSTQQIQLIAKFISENLNPFPARSHWGDVRNPIKVSSQVYHQPDVLIYHLNDHSENQLVVEIILPLRGTLRVNPLFKQAIKKIENDKAVDWKQDLEKASLLVKCIQQRNNTMRLLLEKLVKLQKPFILKGEKYMKSITRAKIAQELEVHESTISRAVSGKSVQLPNKRIVPMSLFFDRSLSVRSVVKEIIEAETHPLSDTEIQNLLKEQGITVARRTVAKYRSKEGILPAHLRHARELATT